jgi:hypothetical protein
MADPGSQISQVSHANLTAKLTDRKGQNGRFDTFVRISKKIKSLRGVKQASN